MTAHAQAINRNVRSAGVVWMACEGCGRDWPFPKGAAGSMDREWRCAACVNALWSKLQRAKRNVLAFVNAIGEISIAEAQAAIEKEWL